MPLLRSLACAAAVACSRAAFLEAPQLGDAEAHHKEVLEKLHEMDAQAKKDTEKRSATLSQMGPVLEKLRGLDPKTFGLLSDMMKHVEGDAPTSSFLQYVRDDPDAVSLRLEKLGPILQHLQHLDKRRFGALAGVVSAVDPATNMDAAVDEERAQPAPTSQRRVQRSRRQQTVARAPEVPVNLDDLSWHFNAFLQKDTPQDDTEAKLEDLAPVLDRLRGLDPKAFGMLSSLVSKVPEDKK
jgi:hypothetical protein